MTPVRVERLTKAFGDLRAVTELSFSVAPGEIYGLLGPNGAGKTTALRILAGLLAPTSGRALLMGREIGGSGADARGLLGFLSGTTGLYARLTPREVLTHFGRLYGLAGEALAARIAAVTDALELAAFLDRRCEVLSTGQKQRVSVGRAVLHDPPVLILDEPTSGLDVLASRFLRDLVKAERDRGKAILFSTHYLAEAELLCDRIGFLHQGRLLVEGSPAALRERTGAGTLEEAFLRLVDGLGDGRGGDPGRPGQSDEGEPA